MTWTQFDEYGSSASTDSSIIRFSRSEDGSMTWSPPVRISQKAGDCVDSDNTVEGAVPAVGPEGQVYVAWSGPEGIVFDKSYDHGESWLEQDIFVTEQPTGWDMSIPGISRANGMPVTVCDTSGGQYNGTIYIAFADQRNGENDTDIWLTKSTDEGNSWTTPIRVNDDPPGKHQFFVWMDVDQTNGNLYLVFYDRRNYTDRQTDVFIALSEDGGNSFLNFKISETPFTPTSSVFFGDYTNISVHGGIVRPVWTRLDGITTSLWTAIVDINSLEIQPALTPLSNSSTYPNPFSDQLIMAFELKHATRLNIELFNINGKKLITLAQNKSYGPGQHIENFSYVAPSIPPGIYYISLSGNDFHTIKKLYTINITDNH